MVKSLLAALLSTALAVTATMPLPTLAAVAMATTNAAARAPGRLENGFMARLPLGLACEGTYLGGGFLEKPCGRFRQA